MNFLLLGATGNLARTKIIPALHSLSLPYFLYGRKASDDTQYIQGELHEIAAKVQAKGITHVYVALPPHAYKTVLGQMVLLDSLEVIALEKPFGTSLEEARELKEYIEVLGLQDKVYLVDHYNAKDGLVRIDNMSEIARISISFFENKNAEGRGSFYDAVGAIKDVIQNHCLAILEHALGGELFGKVQYERGSLTRAQYDEYRDEPGVTENSQTETYAECKLAAGETVIEICAGKGLSNAEVSIEIENKGGGRERSVISGEAYSRVLADFIANRREYAVSIEEALRYWEIAEQILSDRDTAPFCFYPQGQDPRKGICSPVRVLE